jgi:hypothetical protein
MTRFDPYWSFCRLWLRVGFYAWQERSWMRSVTP